MGSTPGNAVPWQPPPQLMPVPSRGSINLAAPPAHSGGHVWDSADATPKRPRIPEDPSQVDTVASVGAADVGFDEFTLHTFFQSLPGFVVFKPNPRMGGGFVKFQSASLAIQAVTKSRE